MYMYMYMYICICLCICICICVYICICICSTYYVICIWNNLKAGSRTSFIVLLLSEALAVSRPWVVQVLPPISCNLPNTISTMDHCICVFVSAVFLPRNAICICPSGQLIHTIFGELRHENISNALLKINLTKLLRSNL